MAATHVPVMRDEVVALFAAAPDGPIVDATLGAGGHAMAIARARRERHGTATVLGIDRDPQALRLARRAFDGLDHVTLEAAEVRFDALAAEVAARGWEDVAGVFFDLGVSSMHLDRAERGFSYRHDGPLDMRMGPDARRSAAELIAAATVDELAAVLRDYGEERHAGRIARAIKHADRLETTGQLAEVVAAAMPPGAAAHDRGHPARRTFQALRIAVNGELEALERALPDALGLLVPGGIAAVLAYHSLEDRIVKQTFARAATDCICPPGLPVCACGHVATVAHVIRRPQRPTPDEIDRNPRASAARLRAVEKLETP